jgi:hypothetical protein
MCPTGRHDGTEAILTWSREDHTTKQQKCQKCRREGIIRSLDSERVSEESGERRILNRCTVIR